jgi:SAM-dependent methyltransferase
MHTNSILLFKKYALSQFVSGIKVLEIGPDDFPSTYKTIVGNSCDHWDTLDLQRDDRLTYVATSEYSFPIADHSYDIVLSGQVIGHVRKIWLWMKEVSRVCKIGGKVITINPVSWPYHEAPVDCWRIYPEGMKALCEEASLRVLHSSFESLEVTGGKRPGVSSQNQSPRWRLANRAFGLMGLPVECSFDAITIAEKI